MATTLQSKVHLCHNHIKYNSDGSLHRVMYFTPIIFCLGKDTNHHVENYGKLKPPIKGNTYNS